MNEWCLSCIKNVLPRGHIYDKPSLDWNRLILFRVFYLFFNSESLTLRIKWKWNIFRCDVMNPWPKLIDCIVLFLISSLEYLVLDLFGFLIFAFEIRLQWLNEWKTLMEMNNKIKTIFNSLGSDNSFFSIQFFHFQIFIYLSFSFGLGLFLCCR